MKTGFASHFEHKDDSCTDMAKKATSQKGSKHRSGQDPKVFGLIYKSKRAVCGSAMLCEKHSKTKRCQSENRFMIRNP